jgi:hypothetical protein
MTTYSEQFPAGRRKWVAALASAGLVASAFFAWQSPSSHADTAPDPGTPSTVSADALPTAQIGNGVVWSQVTVGNIVYATGQFTTARPPGVAVGGVGQVSRAGILAYDITTGQLTSFNHSLNGQGRIIVASPDGSRVYVGGDFTTVDGRSHPHIAAFSTADGSLVSTFAPTVSGSVLGLAVTGSTVYAGGSFGSAGGTSRANLVAFSVSAGALQAWNPGANSTVTAMVAAPDQSRIIIAGRFTTLAGGSHYGIGSVYASTGAQAPWPASFPIRDAGSNAALTTLTSDGTQIYGTGYVFGSGGNFEGSFAADPYTGSLNWLNSCHGDSYAAFEAGQVVYTVGHAHDCSDIGAFDDTSPRTWHRAIATTAYPTGTELHNNNSGYSDFYGQPDPSLLQWYPTLTAGTFTGSSQAAWAASGNANYVALGGEFPSVNGTAQQGLVRFAVRAIAPNHRGPIYQTTLIPTVSSPASGLVRLTWKSVWDMDNQTLKYEILRDSNTTPVGTLTSKSNFWTLPNLGFTDAGVPTGSHTYKVRVTDPTGNVLTSPSSASITVSSTSQISQYAKDVKGDGASHYWRLGESSGTTGYDWAGVADLTELSGVTQGAAGAVDGDSNGASNFNGSSTGTAGSSSVGAAPSVFSAEAWFTTTSGAGGKIIGFGNSQTGSSTSFDRQVYLDNAGHVIFGVYNAAAHTVSTSSTYNDGKWHHVVATLSSTGMVLYVDGVQVGSDANTVAQALNGYWRIGGDNLSGWPSRPTSDYLKGTIDEVAVYPTALTATQVQRHYTDSANPVPTAAFTSSCQVLVCDYDASSSSDVNGVVAAYSWNFGDGSAPGSGATPSHTYAAAGTYPVVLTVTDNEGATDTVTHSVTVTATVTPKILASDDFSRTVSAGWGTADKGGAWTTASGTRFAVDGSVGTMTIPTPGGGPSIFQNDVASTDTDVQVTFSSAQSPTGGGIIVWAAGRHIVGSGDYRAKVHLLATGAVGLSLTRTNSTGTEAQITPEATVAGLTYTPGMKLTLRVQATGADPTTVRAKVWPSASTEPTAWAASASDGTAGLQTPGGVGILGYVSASATTVPVVLSFDGWQVAEASTLP